MDGDKPQIRREEPSPFPKIFEEEMALVRSDLKAILEPDKPLFEYANYVLRLLAWWVATAVALKAAHGIANTSWRLLAYLGLGLAGLFGCLLTYRLLMINRAMADAVAWRYHQRGRWGVIVALTVSFSLMVPFAAMVLLIWSAIARLGPVFTI
ncbi:hypothetical protein VVT58_01380 [Sphingobium sp. SJ10-10]|uniref:hypothetical protein n=1 Tax=Sphingobium sp. SJ10-10 TaxID=3114999 RepID=UPI002E19ADB0|nr:hypothetical protein [Sphingobium sp. SJ10-10]